MADRPLIFPLPYSPHRCPYLDGRQASFEHYYFVHYDEAFFIRALETGFRHFGPYFFRPACAGEGGVGVCGACLPIRIPIGRFVPTKGQRRVLRKGQAVTMRVTRPRYSDKKFDLYLRHQERFTKNGVIGAPEQGSGSARDRESFKHSFYQPQPFTWECQYELDGQLIGVGYLDLTERVASSIYFYFDPAWESLSPGTLSILREIEYCRAQEIPYYYLGYAVQTNRSMQYKMGFYPCEVHDGRGWRPLRNEQGDYLIDPGKMRTGPFAPLIDRNEVNE